ncbi:MAG: hypothetical protein ACRD19_00270 [Terriglobia bacterium]
MPAPILVVHGVANRDEHAFHAQVEDVQNRIGGDYRLIPVWWGDLGGKTEYLRDTLPDTAGVTVRGRAAGEIDEAAIVELLRGAFVTGTEQKVRSEDEREEIIIRAAQAQPDSAAQVRSEHADELARAIREAWQEATYLRLVRSDAVLEAVGRAVGAATGNVVPFDGTDEEVVTRAFTERDPFAEEVATRSVREKAGKIARAVVSEIDKVVGGVIGQVLGDVNQTLRGAWAERIGYFLGDILAYQRNQAAIQERLSKAVSEHADGWGMEGKPISVIAHSLGGVIAFDAATRSMAPLWIDGLVTFGSQPAFFEILDPRESLPRYRTGNPISLPKTIGRWTNLWEPLDVLAFAAGKVFRLHSGLSPTDLQTAHDLSYGLATHSTYWGSPELVAAIQQTVGA